MREKKLEKRVFVRTSKIWRVFLSQAFQNVGEKKASKTFNFQFEKSEGKKNLCTLIHLLTQLTKTRIFLYNCIAQIIVFSFRNCKKNCSNTASTLGLQFLPLRVTFVPTAPTGSTGKFSSKRPHGPNGPSWKNSQNKPNGEKQPKLTQRSNRKKVAKWNSTGPTCPIVIVIRIVTNFGKNLNPAVWVPIEYHIT